MRILIVGNDPKEIGGVANYTRPLATKFAEMGHNVFYLYSGAYTSKYDFRLSPYLKFNKNDFPFECAEIINSVNLPFNYGHPELDMKAPEMDELISQYLDSTKPDVMHINSRFGFPTSINQVAFDKGITVLNTIHVYGYICQKRVMIDYEGKPCLGPSDLNKCAACTGTLNYRKERIRAVLRNYNKKLKVKAPSVFNFLQQFKRSLKSTRATKQQLTVKSIAASAKFTEPQLAEDLTVRLKYCTTALNSYSDKTICVSTDVKRTLMNYGVDGRRLLVQHIGSIIAEKQLANKQYLHTPIVVGNIGGVNHYKGIHILVEAIAKVKNTNFIVRIFGKYEEDFVRSLMGKFSNLEIEFTGRYKPEDLPAILKQIDVMVLPSICNDTAPQTIFESFSGGVPIIASNIGGFPDFVQHDHNGLLFEAGNSDDLAEKIDFVLTDPERLIKYQQNIPKLKTITENAQELIRLYNELLMARSGTNTELEMATLETKGVIG
ncbi:MAG: glycosyltransferase [Chlorobium sp.]|nr:glycosyltransferase [Chlorobium sp.]